MTFKKLTILILLLGVVTACKTTKVLNESMNSSLSSKRVIKNHYTNTFDKETVKAKLKVKYRGKSSLPSITASLRIKKDEIIWISLTKLGFPIGKVLITPNRVSFYEKINRTYFDGDFTLISNLLGTELDFEKVQNLLFGQALLNLKKEAFILASDKNNYLLKPKKANSLYDILFLINPLNFKINSQQINQLDKNNTLIINYPSYTAIDDEIFPKGIYIKASDKNNISTIDVNYKSVEFNKTLNFPFEIPENYEKIVLK